MLVRGWVYVITNKAMPSLVKVGFSTKDPMLRARELDGTGVPHAFEVAYDALVLNPREVEQKSHKILSQYREGKEWFRCTISVAIQAIQQSTEKIHQETKHQDSAVFETGKILNQKCAHYGCDALSSKDYKGRPLCQLHWYQERQQRFEIVRGSDARKQAK